jgi:two-component system, OmpR family, sensor histidine kinase KdpD
MPVKLDRGWDYLISIVIVAFCSVISLPLRSELASTNFAMLYLLGVLFIARYGTRGAAVFISVLSVVAFYYFCIPPFDSFILTEYNFATTLFAMLTVALVISALTVRMRSQTVEALDREARTQELYRLSKELSTAAREAEIAMQTERMRNSLLSAISHDLKTPLVSIYGAATSLLDQGERLSGPARRELIEGIAEESDRLNRVMTNLLEMTRLDAGLEMTKDWQSVEEIVGAALERLKSDLRGRVVTTRIPSDLPLLRVDEVLLEQVLINLLENVIKYSPEDSAVEVVAAAHGDRVRISVCDFGAGFAPGDEQRVFEKFFRGRTDVSRGMGLGLSICRAIVLAHKGEIRAENRPSGGAAVHIDLPIGGSPPELSMISESAFK